VDNKFFKFVISGESYVYMRGYIMFCVNCGKQISSDAVFCPFCGKGTNQIMPNNPSNVKNCNYVEKKKRNKIWTTVLAMVAILIIAFPIRYAAEKAIVKSAVENKLHMIKEGPSEETMNQVIVALFSEITGSDTVAVIINDYISGQDVKDIYDSLMLHMSYKVQKVERLDSSHYKVTVKISNMNNLNVASLALQSFLDRYKQKNLIDAIIQAKDDWNTDKSATIAAFLSDASNGLYNGDKEAYSIMGTYTIDVEKVDGEWKANIEDGVGDFILNCAGFRF
jgi:hypothetical protein